MAATTGQKQQLAEDCPPKAADLDSKHQHEQVARRSTRGLLGEEIPPTVVVAGHDQAQDQDQDQDQESVQLEDMSPAADGVRSDNDRLSEPAMKRTRTITDSKESLPVRRKSRSKWDNPIEMLTNQRSPLGTAMLRDLLCTPRAWDILSDEEKKQVLKEFPLEADILDFGTDRARPNIVSLRNNNNFRHDISRYQENLREGRHDPEWISQAQAAHRKRGLGLYDEFLASKFEEDWGIPMLVADKDEPHCDSDTSASPSAKSEVPSANDRGIELSQNHSADLQPMIETDLVGDSACGTGTATNGDHPNGVSASGTCRDSGKESVPENELSRPEPLS
ncbi:Asx homology domain-containing protein [Microdochium trichocladiopsis]|uniref:Asx homology domain-containing protein n=1 Tax=Microdochium trichocladiopsis TaxID=1682393 RepID=A0A9P9BRV7_9PEZI|nr:Asx homology domain-containing protein [Microdochium trichocladiopsis]KAH7033341.1 Asx homology domain-containing protein [Microdochium trichocladiopsis]